MKELVQILQKEDCNIQLYLQQINSLSDEEIEELFKDKSISANIKEELLTIAFDRMNRLSTKSFIRVSSWAENTEDYIKHYLPKIEKMSYLEFVDLLYNGIYEPDILREIIKTSIYSKFLQQEKEKRRLYDLQCFDIQAKLDAFQNNEELDKIGKEMLNLIKRANSKTEDIETAEHVYLRTLIENIDFVDLKSDAIKYGLDLMTMQMQRHEVLTNEMVEFYLYYRIKELNLKDTCKNVFVSAEESNLFGYYTLEGNGLKGGTLKIYSKYLTNLFGKYTKKWTREGINDVINLNYIRMLSHELKHNLKMQKCGKKLENSDAIQFFNQIGTNKEINYYTRNSILQNRVGKEIYRNNHKTFIEEAQADLFAIFDANFQLLIDFEGAFPKYILENFVSGNAKSIISFYTNEEGIMLSPMEKFDIFYKANIGDEEDPIVEEENPDIMNSLMTGDKIPLDVFEFLQKIAKGEIKTTDLYETLTAYIESRTNTNQFVTEELNEESSLSIR